MSASDVTRKRLNSLKALTEELKDRTKNAPLDLSHIRELLSSTRQLHTSQAHRPPAPDSGENLQSDSSFRPLFPEKSKNGDSDEEVMQLRQENVVLQQKISHLKGEIGQLQEDKRRLEAAAQNRMNQGFKITDSVQGFVGRLALPAENYDRLEYSAYDIELQLDKIILLRREKGAVQEFSLQGLRGAEYCGTTLIVLRFQEFLEESSSVHPLTSVFLKFYSEDQLKKWDVALYSNYHIVNSLEQERLFQRYFRCMKLDEEAQAQNQRIKAIRESVQLDHDKEKDLLKLLLQKREEYKEVEQLIRQKLDHKIKANMALNKEEKELIGEEPPEVERPKQEPVSKPNSNQTFISIEKIEELEPHQEQSQKMIRPPSQVSQSSMHNSQMHAFHIKHTDSNMVGYIEPPIFLNTEPRASRIAQSPQLYNSTTGQPGNFPLSPPPFIPGSQSQLRESKATLVNQLNMPEGRGQSFESSLHNNSLSKIKQGGQERLHNARVKLQNGYYATKYSKDGFSPHDKKVFLSLDSRKLCWSDRDKQSEYKSVPISVLVKVEYGVVGEGIAKHVKNPDARYFCVIEYYTSDSKKKTIQLGSGNMQDIKEFSSQLAIFIKERSIILPN